MCKQTTKRGCRNWFSSQCQIARGEVWLINYLDSMPKGWEQNEQCWIKSTLRDIV